MTGRFSICSFVIVSILSQNSFAKTSGGNEVKFDAPAILTARCLVVEGAVLNGEKIVEVVLPVSSQIRAELRGTMNEFRYDVFWNRTAYPVFDYGPKTRTAAEIDGMISVEKRTERNRSLGFELNSGYDDVVAGNAKAQFSNKNGSTVRYQEIPQHDVFVASGTVKRGTGAFFRFHPSKQETLEGGRDLVVAFRVPSSWRGGILQIECRADGEKKLLGPWGDEIHVGQAFVMPVYLEGDNQARESALQFAQTQIDLTQKWSRRIQSRKKTSGGFKRDLEALFGTVHHSPTVPAAWTQHLIQTGDDRHYDKYHRQLSEPMRTAAKDFIQARKDMIALAR